MADQRELHTNQQFMAQVIEERIRNQNPGVGILIYLPSIRSSISGDERKRLAAIYREFIVGRNGEMPNGDGGREISGRTSIM